MALIGGTSIADAFRDYLLGWVEQGHRWSGWPGAWCLDCGLDDPMEYALAQGWWYFYPDENGDPVEHKDWPDEETEREFMTAMARCIAPGAKIFDPYWHKAQERDRMQTDAGAQEA